MDTPIPCTTAGCESVKFFAGRCNPCTAQLEGPRKAVSTTWVEECMAKQAGR